MFNNNLYLNEMMLHADSISLKIDNDALGFLLRFVSSRQLAVGGFCGRSSQPDLYYTFFAITILVTMGGTFNTGLLSDYLDSFGDGAELDFIHLACLIRCQAIMGDADGDMLNRQLKLIEEYRADDGGYQQSGKGLATGSVYACFIAWLVYADVDKEVLDQDGIISCLESFKLADGSYVNDLSVKSGSTIATAAAVVLLFGLGLPVGASTISQLLSRTVVTGGFLAGETAPIPDLLSTATALYALRRVGHDLAKSIDVHHDYVASLWNEDGGFSGNALDGISDCEYTYYALLAF